MLTPHELEFFAEDTLVPVISNFKFDKMHFISDSYGPFLPGNQIIIPLWLATTLKKRHRVNFCAPVWFNVNTIQAFIDFEKDIEHKGVFFEVPNTYIEQAHLLIKYAGEDIPELPTLCLLVEELIDVRLSKLRQAFKDFEDPLFLSFKNISMMEININRSIVSNYMDFRFQFSALMN